MMLTDLRHAARGLWHARGFTTVAVVCLSLGIGLNTTIFSIVDGVLLTPFPYANADRIVDVMSVNQPLGVTTGGLSYDDMNDLKASASTLAGIGGSSSRSLTISDGAGEPERYVGSAVTWDLFPLLGVAPVIGTGFTAEQDRPGGGGVVLLSHAVWTNRYQADPAVIGRQILVNREPAIVIGVMPEGFEFPERQKVWIPMAPVEDASPRSRRGVYAFGWLAPDATIEQARAELATLSAGLERQHPDTNRDWSVSARTLREAFIPTDVSLVIWLMMGAVTLVLFIACSNVANLLLARASGRRREIAVRTALGAGRRQLVRQLLFESLWLGLLSVPLGLLLAKAGTSMIYAAMPLEDVPYYITWQLDVRAAAYAIGVAVTTALLFGLFPALQATRGSLHADLKEGTRGNSARRSLLRSGLVVVQVSLSLVALVGALLFVRSFSNLDSYEVGFDPAPLMTMRFYLSGDEYAPVDARGLQVRNIVERIEGLPGVEAAFASNLVPVSGGGNGANIVVDGQPSEPGREPFIGFTGVTPHYLQALGVTPAQGRNLTDAEGWSRSPVALVNQTMADRFWPNGGAVGARFRAVNFATAPDWFTVAGVVPDVKHDDIDPDDRPFPQAYVSYMYDQTVNTGITIRVAGPPAAVTAAARAEIRAADPNAPVFAVSTMEDLRRLGFWEFGLFGWIFGTIGVVGLLLASTGVYGVLSYAVSQRTAEIGVRVALGAGRTDVLRLIVSHGLWLAGIGVLLGLVITPATTYLGQSLFYNVSPFDPLTFAAVAVFLLIVALLASGVPALRATRVDPLIALRGD